MPKSAQTRFSLARLAQPAATVPAVLAVAAGAIACTSTTSVSGTAAGIGASAAQLQSQYERVVQHVLPSVVQISAASSTGSGVVYDTSGDIVTNAHVIGNASTVTVREPVGTKEVSATVLGTFPADDLAVIRVSSGAGSLKPASFANSDKVEVGQIVLAMGNPLGLSDSVTQGIVSATGRTVGEGGGSTALITAAIQTSAAINPGNSGGALVDLAYQVVGIPTLAAQLPNAGGAAPGIGFAIPSDTVKNIAGQLIKNGKVTKSDRATLGITAQTAVDASGSPIGVAVIAVNPGSPAALAGVTAGDVIVGINDRRISTLQDLETTLAQLTPGTKVTVHYTRDGSAAVRSGRATLGSLTS